MIDPIKQRLRQIRQACELGPLSGDNLDRYWIDTDQARDPLRSVRKTLSELLEDRDDAKILFYGHGGSGKSTELNKLVAELDHGRYLIAKFSAREEMNLVDVSSEDIIVVLMERLVHAADQAGLVIDRDALDGVYSYFATVTQTDKALRASEARLSAGAEAATPTLLADLLKLFVDFKAEVRFDARSETTRVATLRKRPGDLIAYANRLIEAVRASLPDDQRLLFIVEDLDKLDIATARQVFIEKPTLLTGLNAAIIYTIPIFTFQSPDAAILRRHFHSSLSLPMIKTQYPDGTRADGFAVVQDIVRERLGDAALTPAALDLLVEKTGGVLQHAFEVIVGATLLRNASVPLTEEQLRHSLQRRKSEFLTEITLPYEPVPGLDKIEQLYERLDECLGLQRQNQPCKPGSGQFIDQVLLKACALVEYNGARWLGVHPLVQEILADRQP